MGKSRGKIQDQNMELRIHEGNEKEHEENYEEPLLDHEDEKLIKRALIDFKCKVEDAMHGNYLFGIPDTHPCHNQTTKETEQLNEIKLWGVALMPSKPHEGTDTLLLKFLKSKNYVVHEALEKLRKTLAWRKEFKADEILEENLGPEFQKVAYLNTVDKEGRPVFYHVYGDLKDKPMQYLEKMRSEENSDKFLRWRVQQMEKCIKELNFEPGGADSLIQVIDWKDFQGPHTKELRSVYRKCWTLLEEHYPEIIHQYIIVNVPLRYYVSHSFSSRLITHKPSNKIIFARPGKVTETLLRFISPENLLVEYGGLKRINDNEFSSEHKVFELNLKAHASTHIEIPAPEVGVTIVWDVTVVEWDVTYKEEFIPEDEGSYQVLLQDKEKKGGERPCVRNSYYINEGGVISIFIHNHINKCKKVFYRYKTKPTVPTYLLYKT
ncbi:hypothetical protein Goarm_019253 [Gossypium armourianum]|uniref:CRAL-TRIO domain-containing protein n=1 Tax=Gossypium armourianum TaxID=34283 RepID=A0A7J9IJZ1_9ROSI|nr:hypothetical protein [Gossypium armourianum]